jgi:hypothetical protein
LREEGAPHIWGRSMLNTALKCSETKMWGKEFVCSKWLNTNEDTECYKTTNNTNVIK